MKCHYCGKDYVKKHNRQVYCSDSCRSNARREKQAEYTRKYRRKYKGVLPDSTLYGLGSGRLGSHCNSDWMREYKKIQREYIFLKIKPRKSVKV